MLDSPRGRLLAWLLLLLLAASAVEVRYLTLLSPANLRLAREWSGESVDQPGYPEFLREVESRTPPGSRIVIVVPRRWFEGYAYAYYRANYLVGDRVILPAIGTDDVPIRSNLLGADFVAAWAMELPVATHEEVWRGFRGSLLRKRAPSP